MALAILLGIGHAPVDLAHPRQTRRRLQAVPWVRSVPKLIRCGITPNE
jgi:hypothetical protein